MRTTADQLTQMLAKSGVNASTLKSRIRADIAWQQLVRGRYQASLQIGEKDLLGDGSDRRMNRSATISRCGRSFF